MQPDAGILIFISKKGRTDVRAKRYRKSALLGLTAAAETKMAKVLVTGDKLIDPPSMQASKTVYTGSEITSKGIEMHPDSTGLAA